MLLIAHPRHPAATETAHGADHHHHDYGAGAGPTASTGAAASTGTCAHPDPGTPDYCGCADPILNTCRNCPAWRWR